MLTGQMFARPGMNGILPSKNSPVRLMRTLVCDLWGDIQGVWRGPRDIIEFLEEHVQLEIIVRNNISTMFSGLRTAMIFLWTDVDLTEGFA